ncbi:MAG: peptidoglycan-binding protein [Christensenellales bacterium]|jgi:peptidoglycan hydrolase-like protein with peptidoglycan-binding domain
MLKRSLAFILFIVLILSLSPISAEQLQYRDKGKRVQELQQLLKEKNYYSGKIDGIYSYAVVEAVRSFQRSVGLQPDGIAGPYTLVAIGMEKASPPPSTKEFPLRYGCENDQVKTVQTKLKNLNYYSGSIDGKYYDDTLKAVRLFQMQNGLVVDGIVGQKTLNTLESGKPYNSNAPKPASIRIQYRQTGSTVFTVKNRLQHLGYLSSATPLTDLFDYVTFKAVRNFQKKNKLKVDGIVGEETWKVLFGSGAIASNNKPFTPPDTSAVDSKSTNTLRYGNSNAEVAKLQEQLKALGYYKGPIQHLFDYRTYMAVRAYQQAKGLQIDGIAGPVTRSAISGSLSEPHVDKPDVPGGGAVSLTIIEIAKMQIRLNALGYYSHIIDGKYGPNTVNAVRAFKIKNGFFTDKNGNGIYDADDEVTNTLTATVYNKIFASDAKPATP